MEQAVKVAFYLKRNETKEDGKCPVMARLRVGQSEVVFSAKMRIWARDWTGGRVSGKSKTANAANRQLDEFRASALSIYRELSSVRVKVTAADLKNVLLGMASGQESLLSYFSSHNENFDQRAGVNRAEGTAKSYRYALNHLAKFLYAEYKLSDIPFTALNRSVIEKYDLHLRVVCGLGSGTIVLLMTRLNTIVGSAIAEGILTSDPFAGYAPQRPKRVQKYLTRECTSSI